MATYRMVYGDEEQVVRETFTDPAHQTVVIRARFTPGGSPLRLYVYVDPAVDNSGFHDTADAAGDALVPLVWLSR